MPPELYFHNCSQEYIDSIDPALYEDVLTITSKLPKRKTQSEINVDLFWMLTAKGWSFDTTPPATNEFPPDKLPIQKVNLNELKKNNRRDYCITSSTLEAKWHSDFAKMYDGSLVQLEVQFGKVESMFKDFCGFKIAGYERRLALGIEIVMSEPSKYFSHRKGSVSGMAYFDIAKKTLPAIGFDCPIWLIGIKE